MYENASTDTQKRWKTMSYWILENVDGWASIKLFLPHQLWPDRISTFSRKLPNHERWPVLTAQWPKSTIHSWGPWKPCSTAVTWWAVLKCVAKASSHHFHCELFEVRHTPARQDIEHTSCTFELHNCSWRIGALFWCYMCVELASTLLETRHILRK